MNPLDSIWERLAGAARHAEEPLPSAAPFGVETRVLASWRRGLRPEPRTFLPLVRKAGLCACFIILITAVLSLHSSRETPNELGVVDSIIQLSLMQ